MGTASIAGNLYIFQWLLVREKAYCKNGRSVCVMLIKVPIEELIKYFWIVKADKNIRFLYKFLEF